MKPEKYNPQIIEPKWQRRWEADGLYKAIRGGDKPKFYFLTMLPYTSGDLHIGHWYAMAPSDAKARYTRMKGYNVLFPIGFDAFGLPAENAAIKHGIHPKKWTYDNIERMRRQLKSMGAMFDWDREAITCDPEYYKWTQWFFLKFYEHGLAYRTKAPVDWCPKCNTTLAREQVWGEDRHCERCGTPVIRKDLEQWFFRITDYAEELLDFSKIDWPERVRVMQTNWIGRSEGANVTFHSEEGDEIVVFTTRPDTLWGATFMVLAPEHPLVEKLTAAEQRNLVQEYTYQASRQSEIERLSVEKEKTGVFTGAYAINPVNNERIPIWVADYVLMTYGTGAIMGVPAHDERDFEFAITFGLPIIPVIARSDGVAKSFVFPGSMRPGLAEALSKVGIEFTAGPYRDLGEALYVTLHGAEQIDRYIELVRAYLLPGRWNTVVGTRWVFVFEDGIRELNSVEADREILARCKHLEPAVRDKRTVMEMLWELEFYRDILFHTEYGTMVNSGPLSGTPGDVAVKRTTQWLEERGLGRYAVNYRLHDWLISRQRYWGAPIPIVYCDRCGIVPVPEEDLPVLLPDDAEFLPTGESPLKYHPGFLNTTCPACGGPAKRETDTMDTFMCSSWYHMRYLSPKYDKGPFDPAEAEYWLPVDQYTGGIEHATMHLLYTRFFTKACRDIGILNLDEPMLRLYNQGIILGEDNEKMSKSRGNVVNPDDYVQTMGADTVRAYLMFIGPWEEGGPWSSRGIEGIHRFLNRVWSVVLHPAKQTDAKPAEEDVVALRRITHQTIRRVTTDMERFQFNTMLAALMEYNNYLMKVKNTPVVGTEAWKEAIRALVLMLAPVAPHIAEEMWERIGGPYSVHQQSWPQWDEALAAEKSVTLVVQINGKVRDKLEVPAGLDEKQARAIAMASPKVNKYIEGREVIKTVYVRDRLINIVVK
ncbi:MAG: leucine--tRNA ligase [Chloroflexi bacterium]|nr:leucine--tRNA ligase [Chloroflexota bacterium]